jgi:hypothetical protein
LHRFYGSQCGLIQSAHTFLLHFFPTPGVTLAFAKAIQFGVKAICSAFFDNTRTKLGSLATQQLSVV